MSYKRTSLAFSKYKKILVSFKRMEFREKTQKKNYQKIWNVRLKRLNQPNALIFMLMLSREAKKYIYQCQRKNLSKNRKF